MQQARYWTITVESRSGEQRIYTVAYPRKPTDDLAAGLVRPQLGMPLALPAAYRCRDEASLRALEAAGYRLVAVRVR